MNIKHSLFLSLLMFSCLYCSIVNSDSVDQTQSNEQHDIFLSDSYKAIRILHTKLDSDADGEVDDLESKKFLESDKIKVNDNNQGAYSTAHKLRYLHQDGKDRSISVDELWEAWTSSQVHNWTIEETIYWLENYVELPEYSPLFEQHSVNGSLLPRLAAETHFISRLGITDPSAKNKLSIKAMDVVLFGPPKLGNGSKVRDFIVSVIIAIALIFCYIFYSKLCASQQALRKLKDNMESLQKAEDQMSDMQQQLDKALKAQEEVSRDKKNLEHQLEMQRQYSATSLSNDDDTPTTKESYAIKLEEEVKSLREELKEAYESLNAKKFRAPYPLKNLLQLTYNIESQYCNEKKLSLESKATEVKLRNQKLQKKKTSFLGYYKMAQENSLEEDINIIVEVKEAIMQVTKEIKERTERWRTIEELCGCSLGLTPLKQHSGQIVPIN